MSDSASVWRYSLFIVKGVLQRCASVSLIIKKELPQFSAICIELCVKMRKDIMCILSSQTGANESGLLGQHLARTVVAGIRLVCALSVLLSCPRFLSALSVFPCVEASFFLSASQFGTVLIQPLWAVAQLSSVRRRVMCGTTFKSDHGSLFSVVRKSRSQTGSSKGGKKKKPFLFGTSNFCFQES